MSHSTSTTIKNGVATITLKKPKRLNALDDQLIASLIASLRAAEENPEVRVVIITGEGRFFSAGADLTSSDRSLDMGKVAFLQLTGSYHPLIKTICELKKLVIAAVNGGAVGAGASIALACDFRVMADNSYFNITFINIALVPDAGASYFLTRQLGYSKALEFALEGKPVSAEQCLALHLTNKVVPASQLLEKTQEWAEELAEKSSYAVWGTKYLFRNSQLVDLSQTIFSEAQVQRYAVGSQENFEGVQAFFEKRKPNFRTTQQVNVPRETIVSRL